MIIGNVAQCVDKRKRASTMVEMSDFEGLLQAPSIPPSHPSASILTGQIIDEVIADLRRRNGRFFVEVLGDLPLLHTASVGMLGPRTPQFGAIGSALSAKRSIHFPFCIHHSPNGRTECVIWRGSRIDPLEDRPLPLEPSALSAIFANIRHPRLPSPLEPIDFSAQSSLQSLLNLLLLLLLQH